MSSHSGHIWWRSSARCLNCLCHGERLIDWCLITSRSPSSEANTVGGQQEDMMSSHSDEYEVKAQALLCRGDPLFVCFRTYRSAEERKTLALAWARAGRHWVNSFVRCGESTGVKEMNGSCICGELTGGNLTAKQSRAGLIDGVSD
ncbi:hypothetical protein MHYP_G00218110 [Metynnis hypsauchen]